MKKINDKLLREGQTHGKDKESGNDKVLFDK